MQPIQPLNTQQQKWVEDTLASLSLEERVGQLLLPTVGNDAAADALAAHIKDIPFGGFFMWCGSADDHRARVERLQGLSKVPLLVTADLEAGPGAVIHDAPMFPDTLAVSAANDEELAYTMASAAAIYGRNVGINWTFAPIVDVNINPDNSITSTRSLGDDPERIIRISSAIIRGFQDHGMAACAKHFPGDGVDDLDQHTVTTVNSLPLERWQKLHGRTFQSAYNLGVWTTMIGHVAFPAWDAEIDHRGALRPATVSRRITTDLLRRKMGFDGLIVSDDMNMGGVAGYMSYKERMVACVEAGCDMVLFPRLPDDYHNVLEAVRSGRLSEDQVNESCRRVLELKARVGLHTSDLFGRDPVPEETAAAEAASQQIAERAVHLERDFGPLLPLENLEKGARVLTVTLTSERFDLPLIDEELSRRGYQVDHVMNPDNCLFLAEAMKYDAVFLNFMFKAQWCYGSVRCVGPHNRMFMQSFYMEHPCAVFTSFGSPYHLRMFRGLPNYINAYSSSPQSQRAAVAAWFGEVPMNGSSPVSNLVRDYPGVRG